MQSKNRRVRRASASKTASSPFKRKSGNRPFTKRPSSRGGFSGRPQQRRGSSRKRVQPTFDPSRFINTHPREVKEEVYTAKNTFDTFGLSTELAKNVSMLGMHTPSPIQDQVIEDVLKGRDVIGLAETGTGKTAAFLLPLIEQTLQNPNKQTLILTPTRELAIQINDELRRLAKNMQIFSVICVGGVNIRPQIKTLRRTNHFVIGTPGRVLDLINRKDFKPASVSAVVLDEADRMLDMGFIGDIRKIVSATPKERQTLFFSATTSKETDAIVHDFLRDPLTVSVKKKDITDSIEQNVIPFSEEEKLMTLTTLLSREEFERVIIFGAMKHSVKKLAEQISQHGTPAESIHGNKTHSQRQRALTAFKTGKVKVLVATDVAARGIHVDNVSHVINYDLPGTFEDYVHRIGRTGRGAKKGKALTFVPR